MNNQAFFGQVVEWKQTDSVFFLYTSRVNGQEWMLRINDFPDEPLCTLFVEGVEIGDVDDWPPAWKRPEDFTPDL